MLDGLSARLPARDARLYPFVCLCISEPVGIIAPVGQQPLRLWQTTQQGSCPGVIADLACGHDEADRAAFRVGDGMQFGVHAAFGSTDQTAARVVGPPIFDRRMVAEQCAFR